MSVSVPSSRMSAAAERRWHDHRHALKTQLEEVAVRLLSERGFAAVTVEDITGACGVSRRTFFRYFASKDDVVLGALDGYLDDVRAALTARPPDEPLFTALPAAFGCLADRCVEDRSTTLTCLRIIVSSPTLQNRSETAQQAWERILAEMLAERLGSEREQQLPVQVTAAATLAAVRVAFSRWLATDGEADLRQLVTDAIGILAQPPATPLPLQGPAHPSTGE